MATIADMLALALRYHQGGDLVNTELIYRQILQFEPHRPDVWHLRGTICLALGRPAEAAAYLGHALLLQGKLDEAVAAYQESLRLEPGQVEVLHNLGMALTQQSKREEAVVVFRRALEVRPDLAETLHSLGVALAGLGRGQEAISSYEQALRLKPHVAETHINLGNLLAGQRQLNDAELHFRQALQLQPDQDSAHHGLAAVLQLAGRLDEAAEAYQETLRLRPNFPEGWNNFAKLRCLQGKLDDAVACIEQALRVRPDFPEAWNNLGEVFKQQDKLDDAVACIEQALSLRSDFPEAWNNLGNARRFQDKFDEAVACFRQALRLDAGFAEAHNNLGEALFVQGKLQEAMASYQQALCLKPDSVFAHSALGLVLQELGRLDEALTSYERALRLQPECVVAHHGVGAIRLLQGNFNEGLPAYEWRLKFPQTARPVFSQPYWDGSSVMGRTILLHQEAGLGDTLQFIRYAPLVKQRGGRVLLACHESLLPLLASCPGIDELVPLGSGPPAFDVYALVMSMPFLFRTVLSTIPAEVPYLWADAAHVEHWRRQLDPIKAFKIGIAWQSSGGSRGVRLIQFAPLGQVEGVRLFSLQKGPGMEQLAGVAGRFQVTELGSQFRDFADTAAVMKSLDLVITIDSVIAHCAGALGVPVWVALLAHADWRWMLEREDSPWYPTMRLFRQKQQGDWDAVFQRIAAEVKRKVSGRGRDGF